MTHKTRIERLEASTPPQGDGQHLVVMSWEAPGEYYRIDAQGQRTPCRQADIPPGPVKMTWPEDEPAPVQGER